jgi:hypothetical protein
MMKAISSIETSVVTRATRRHIPEDGIFIRTQADLYVSNTARSVFKAYVALFQEK